jgi:catechol 2,3-dioxygenase-like lactoylglutathione lyase family enzyme
MSVAPTAGRILRLIALGIVLTAGPATAQQQRAAAPHASLNRTTLIVSDIEKSLDFYQRVGLTKVSDRVTSDTDQGGVFGAADLPLTADSKRARVVVLSGDTQSLALVWYDHPELPSARGNLMGVGTGDVIVGVSVPDLQGAYSRLNQIGTRFHQPPARFTGEGPDGAPQSGQRFFAYDPDGHLVEVAQFDTGH